LESLVPTYLKKYALIQKLISQDAISPSRQKRRNFWEGRES
jgi:hypothetical protein